MENEQSKKPVCLQERFPVDSKHIQADTNNPAIQLYGRRFYKDQTPVEYLAEFLMAFCYPKQELEKRGEYSFQIFFTIDEKGHSQYCYYPENRVALKLFAFFPSSKLDTRHSAHRDAYLDALKSIKSYIRGYSDERREEAVRLLQSLFVGFVGVAKNRTWVTHGFLPVSKALIAREVTWQHPAALKDKDVENWESSIKYFDENTRNFLGRGGELLFLQLANLFSTPQHPELSNILNDGEYYGHFENICLKELSKRLETNLRKILEEAVAPLTGLANLIETSLASYRLDSSTKQSNLGWVPSASRTESLLFAYEMDNICSANISELEKLDLLQMLCSMQILRSLCFQARRIDSVEATTPGFIGNYAWIASNPESHINEPIRQMGQSSFSRIDSMLYRAIQSPFLYQNGVQIKEKDIQNGHDNCFRHFRKTAKEIGLVMPRKGTGQRFVITSELLRFLVAALIPPRKRIRLTEFYNRAFAHYGLALGGQALANAFVWNSGKANNDGYTVPSSDADWIVEALRQGGFLVELSDAVSIVHNPG
jgi:hypothetical protein